MQVCAMLEKIMVNQSNQKSLLLSQYKIKQSKPERKALLEYAREKA